MTSELMSNKLMYPKIQEHTKIEYIDYNKRSWTQRLIYNVGTMFILSGSSGAAYGTIKGIMMPIPNELLKIRVNTVLNQMNTHGSRLGHSMGMITLLYGLTEYCITHCSANQIIDYINIEYPGSQQGITGAITGLIYKCPSGFQAMKIAGFLGFVSIYGLQYTKSYMPQFLKSITF